MSKACGSLESTERPRPDEDMSLNEELAFGAEIESNLTIVTVSDTLGMEEKPMQIFSFLIKISDRVD